MSAACGISSFLSVMKDPSAISVPLFNLQLEKKDELVLSLRDEIS